MAHGIKLDTLSMEDLQTLITDAQKALSVKVNAERSELIRKLEALDAIVPARTLPQTRKRSSLGYTHVHPESGHEWEGRGSIPKEWQDIVPKGSTKEFKDEKLKPYRVNR